MSENNTSAPEAFDSLSENIDQVDLTAEFDGPVEQVVERSHWEVSSVASLARTVGGLEVKLEGDDKGSLSAKYIVQEMDSMIAEASEKTCSVLDILELVKRIEALKKYSMTNRLAELRESFGDHRIELAEPEVFDTTIDSELASGYSDEALANAA